MKLANKCWIMLSDEFSYDLLELVLQKFEFLKIRERDIISCRVDGERYMLKGPMMHPWQPDSAWTSFAQIS